MVLAYLVIPEDARHTIRLISAPGQKCAGAPPAFAIARGALAGSDPW
jgi:hypothetical protein